MEDLLRKSCVLIPAYNAVQSIQELISRIQKGFGNVQVIVVDDGSQDGTSQAAAFGRAIVLRHDRNSGKGAALQTGFSFVTKSTHFEFILTMDSDLQHQPEDISKFFTVQKETQTDIVIGQRKRLKSGMPIHRILSNTITSILVSLKTGKYIKDSQCGFRLFRRKVIEAFDLKTTGYEAETEFLIQAVRRGYQIEFVPIQTIYGDEKSHMTHWATTKNFLKVLLRKYT
jgi:glycosyltransferase involved in cell wall biosynthesis